LTEIRAAAAARLGWPIDGAFPKVAALASFRPGVISVRALSVPKWHPSLALTGTTCLGAAARIEGSIAHSLGEHQNDAALEIETTSGNTAVSTSVLPGPHGPLLGWASVSRKVARFQGAISITNLPNYVLKEAELCFPKQL
jgi:2-methylaconitate cis-trans-isomerase PrpF